MSELVLKESSDVDNSSSDDELNRKIKEASNYNFVRLIKSKDKVDKRLLDQYLIQQAHRIGVPLGLDDKIGEEEMMETNQDRRQNKDEKR